MVKKRVFDLTREKIVLQSPTKKQIDCLTLSLLNYIRWFANFTLRCFLKKKKNRKKVFLTIKIFFFSKMPLNLKQGRGPLGTYCGKSFFNSSKPLRRYGFPSCTQFFDYENQAYEKGAIFQYYSWVGLESVISGIGVFNTFFLAIYLCLHLL